MKVASGVYGAAIAGAINVGYTWIKSNGGETQSNEFARNIVKTGGFVVLIGIMSLAEPLNGIAGILGWIFVGIVVLNSGTDILKELGAL